MEGVWMAPVTAQVMMTLVMAFPLIGFCLILPRAAPERKGVIRGEAISHFRERQDFPCPARMLASFRGWV
jgi:hypothetical protein